MRSSASPILTTHPAEMGRLIGKDAAFVQSDREHIALSFAAEHGCVLVLKGKNTVIAEPDGKITVNNQRKQRTFQRRKRRRARGSNCFAMRAGVFRRRCRRSRRLYAHGLAADRLAAKYGEHGLLPRDLPAEIGAILG
jgi:NAD(P)H-hydrate epimerase